MNSISKLIYLSDILPNFQVFFICLAYIYLLVILVAIVVIMPDPSLANPERSNKYKRAGRLIRFNLPVILLMFVMSSFIPSKNTLLMIAASEASEKVMFSPQSQNIISSLTKTLEGINK